MRSPELRSDGNPVLDNRAYSGVVTLKEGEAAVVATEVDKSESLAISGTPGISEIPGMNNLTGKDLQTELCDDRDRDDAARGARHAGRRAHCHDARRRSFRRRIRPHFSQRSQSSANQNRAKLLRAGRPSAQPAWRPALQVSSAGEKCGRYFAATPSSLIWKSMIFFSTS